MEKKNNGQRRDSAQHGAHTHTHTSRRKTRSNFNLYVIIAITQKLFAIERTHHHRCHHNSLHRLFDCIAGISSALAVGAPYCTQYITISVCINCIMARWNVPRMHIITPSRHSNKQQRKDTIHIHIWQQIGEIEIGEREREQARILCKRTKNNNEYYYNANDITEFIIAHTITLKMASA